VAETVYIRPITEAELDILIPLSEDPEQAGPFAFYGYGDPERQRRHLAENGFLDDNYGRLAVAVGASLASSVCVGDVSWHRTTTGPTSSSWNIGIALAPSARGRGYGSAAQRLLGEYLFAHSQLNRVEASTEVDNVAERRALEKAGFTFEGVLRGACFRAGRWRDMASYSMIRSDLS
jgi:RimJ/RimL family protein N-acetyltransferase